MIAFKDFLLMTESQTKFVKDLVIAFGDEIVFGGKLIQITESNLKLIYQILNRNLFESKLHDTQIHCWEFAQIKTYLKTFKLDSELDNNFPAMHFILELHDNPRAIKNPIDFKFSDEMIFINTSFAQNSSLEGVIASLCHEMIHSYDVSYGQYRKFFHYELVTGEKMNYHRTQLFRTKMKEANQMGIHVVESLKKNETYADFDQKAYEQLLSSISENDNMSSDYSEEDLVRGYVKINDHCTHIIGKYTCIVNI